MISDKVTDLGPDPGPELGPDSRFEVEFSFSFNSFLFFFFNSFGVSVVVVVVIDFEGVCVRDEELELNELGCDILNLSVLSMHVLT